MFSTLSLPDETSNIARALPIFDRVDPTLYMSMRDAIAVLRPHLPALLDKSAARSGAGHGAGRIVASLAPVGGPAARLYAAERSNRDGADDLVVLYAPSSGQLDAIFVGPQLGRWRVAVLSAIALAAMRIPRGAPACLFGCGGQAAMHVHALETLSPSVIHVVGRDPDRTRSFCRRLSEETGLRLVPMTDPATALRGCEMVVTATSAQTAILEEADIPFSAAIVHVGAKAAGASELPASLYRRANYLFTDAPAELAARFSSTVVHAAGRRLDEVLPLSDDVIPTSDGLRLYISLGVSGAEAILARALLGALPSESSRGA